MDLPTHHVYPPGYPLLLAMTGNHFGLIIALNALLSAATLAIVALVVRRLWSDRAALLCLAVLAVNPVLLGAAGVARSETFFMLLSAAALAFTCLPGAERPGRLAQSAAVSLAAAMTRVAGATLLVGIGTHWLLQRRWKALALYLLAGIATIGLWMWWGTQSAAVHIGESYVADVTAPAARAPGFVSTLALRVRWHVPFYLTRSIPRALAFPAIPGTAVDNIIAVLALTLALAVGVLVVWRPARAVTLYLAATFVMLVLWPWSGTRFLIPLVPLMVPVALAGASGIAGRIRPAAAWPAAIGLAVMLLGGGAARSFGMVRTALECDRDRWQSDPRCVRVDQASFFSALAFIRDSLPDSAVLLSSKPEPLYLYTGRRTTPVRSAIEIPADSILAYLRAYDTRYLLVGSLQSFELDELPDVLEPNCRALRVRGTFPPRTWLLEVLDSPGAAEGDACAVIAQWRAANVGRDFNTDP